MQSYAFGTQTKYTVLHERRRGYTLTLATTEEERDLGVIISSNLKPSAQCLANKAMSVLGMVKRNFRRLDMDSFNVIYKG